LMSFTLTCNGNHRANTKLLKGERLQETGIFEVRKFPNFETVLSEARSRKLVKCDLLRGL
jgi:hypothetical protein